MSDLCIDFLTPRGRVRAVRHASVTVPRNRIVGIVGESGSGKTTLILAVLRLLAGNAEVVGGAIRFAGQDVLAMSEAALRDLRGQRISIVFQDPMTSLNPVLSIGRQMIDVQYRERGRSGREKRARAAALLKRVGIPDPESRIDDFPHQFSGGMRQRIAIAMALLTGPDLLIADEPTTALDVTLEAQIIHLLRELKDDFDGSILFVSHNLGLVAELCDEVVVMYAGEVIEEGSVHDVFHRPGHPYTELLLTCDPASETQGGRELATIPGDIPDLIQVPRGCIFTPRCPKAFAPCPGRPPGWTELGRGQRARCYRLSDA